MVHKIIIDIMLIRIKQLSYIFNEKNPVHWIVLTHKPFRGILIYLSGNFTHPQHSSLTDRDNNRRVDPTATYLPVLATAISMIAALKNPLRRFQYACRRQLRFRQQPASKISTKFYFLNVAAYFPDETCFWFVAGRIISQ